MTPHQNTKLIPIGVQMKKKIYRKWGGGKPKPYFANRNHSPHNVHVCAQFYWFDVLQAKACFQHRMKRKKKCSKECQIFDLFHVILSEWLLLAFCIWVWYRFIFRLWEGKGVRHLRNSLRSWCQFHWKSEKNVSSIFFLHLVCMHVRERGRKTFFLSFGCHLWLAIDIERKATGNAS